MKSARCSQAGEPRMGGGEAAFGRRARAARATDGRCASSARVKSCSSSRPISGDFSEAGEVEIVLRQQHEARQRQQVLDREFLAEVQPVDARHLDALALQRAHQCVHELVAPAHQHHEVAGMQQLALARAALLADQAPWHGRRSGGPAARAAAPARPVGRSRSVVSISASRRADQRPQLDPAGLVLAAGQVAHARPARRRRAPPRPRRTPSRRRRARRASSGTRR